MDERELVDQIARLAGRGGKGLLRGIGDDTAVVRLPGDALLTTDLLVEDVHFRKETHPARGVGHRALARGLSDIAAMGGTPRYCLVSLVLAPWTTLSWVLNFYRGLLRLAKQHEVALAGGDLAHGEKVVCDIVVAGTAPRAGALTRDGARPGDSIWVTGLLGGAALGLERGQGPAWRRHLRPEPRLGAGRALAGRASACMDLSDGLSLDLHRLCLASGVAAELNRPLPVFPGASLDHALHGGEDYELLFTLPEGAAAGASLPRMPRRLGGVPVTRIGAIVKGGPGVVTFLGRPLAPLGYDHFRKR